MDPDGSRIYICGITALLFLLLKAFYTVCETAVIEANDAKIKALSDRNKKFATLNQIITNPGKMLITFSIYNAFSSSVICILSAAAFLENIYGGFIKAGLSSLFSGLFAGIIIVVCTTLAISVFSDTLPKKLASEPSEDFAAACSGAVHILIVFFSPFAFIVAKISGLFGRLFGISQKSGREIVTEEEILMLVEAGNETGIIEESQREMITNVFAFGDVAVSEVMAHRTDIVAVDVNTGLYDVVNIAIEEGFSRIPVYENTVDNIIGILFVKDLLRLIGSEKNAESFSVRKFMREVLYIPETNKCDDVFKYLTRNKAQAAIVVDEYGGTAGMVTMEDLLEKIVGNIQDEYDDEEDEIREISRGIFIIDGSADPEDIIPRLGAELPEGHDYDTMSGMFVDLLGRIPSENETPSVLFENIELTAVAAEDNWISKIRAVVPNE